MDNEYISSISMSNEKYIILLIIYLSPFDNIKNKLRAEIRKAYIDYNK